MAELEIQNLSFAYEDTDVIRDVNLTLHDREIVCLLGTSGGGKTTVFNLIAGLLYPREGKVLLNGADITGTSGQISYMLQKDLLLPYRTIEDNVILPLLVRHVPKKDAREAAAPLFAEFGLEGTQKKYPHQLSGGMRQRAAFLRTYLFSGEAALLDEPFSALDTMTKGDMHKWYLGVMEKLPVSTLFITHDIDEAITLSDRVYILSGKPGTITGEVKIDCPKNERKDFALTGNFLEYKKQILGLLGRK